MAFRGAVTIGDSRRRARCRAGPVAIAWPLFTSGRGAHKTMTAGSSRSTVVPAMRYRDAAAAIEWLCSVIGFEKHLVVPGPDHTIAHAQLVLSGGMLMLGSAGNGSEYGDRIRQPDEIGGFETQS